MKVFKTVEELKNCISIFKQQGRSIGFVPTMGALHKGHTELVKHAGSENDIVVVSIYVNPKQFNNSEDLKNYPRNLDSDLAILEKIDCDIVFAPSTKEVYSEPVKDVYNFDNLEEIMEGKYRSGHFNGVAVVVKRLFEIVQPHRAYFGMKDYQQLLVVKQLVKKTGLPVDIVACATVREPDGLAMSSRNQRLTAQQRKQAATIYKSLVKASGLYHEASIEEIKKIVEKDINDMPVLKLEYFEIVNAENLEPLDPEKKGQIPLACIAVYAGEVRLIDNIIFND